MNNSMFNLFDSSLVLILSNLLPVIALILLVFICIYFNKCTQAFNNGEQQTPVDGASSTVGIIDT